MATSAEIPIEQGTVHIRFTERADGDFQIDLPSGELQSRRATIYDLQWNWLRQTHSADYFVVSAAGQRTGQEGDALVTVNPSCPISVTTADCAPVVLVANRGVAAVHAGWRGLLGGILERTAAELRATAGEPVTALLGPCIHPEAYEFSPKDLAELSKIYGPDVESQTSDGEPALDMVSAVRSALQRCGWTDAQECDLDLSHNTCTSEDGWFSHRTRGDTGRQVTVAWIES